MKAVILAAGIASRLRPLTNNTPKCLLAIGEKNILELTIENLTANNISDIIIVTGYLENQITGFIKSRFPHLNITFIHNEVYGSTNNIYSLWLTKNVLKGDDMLLLDSDIIFDMKIIEKLLNSGYENCLALKRHKVMDEEIKVRADGEGRVQEIGKEVKPAEAVGESVGIEIFRKDTLTELFKIIDHKVTIEKNVNLFYESAFQELINNKKDIFIVDTNGYFCMEIDTPEDLQLAGKLWGAG
jgi:choline kinase